MNYALILLTFNRDLQRQIAKQAFQHTKPYCINAVMAISTSVIDLGNNIVANYISDICSSTYTTTHVAK